MPQNTPLRAYTFPCYSDLADVPAQLQEFATDVDTDVQALINSINTIGKARTSARLTRTAGLATVNNTFIAIPWDSGASPPYYAAGSTITLPKTAVYVASATVFWDANDTGQRRTELRKLTPVLGNLAVDVRDAGVLPAVPIVPSNAVTAVFGATAGDTMEVRIRQTSGGALTMISATFSIMEVSQ